MSRYAHRRLRAQKKQRRAKAAFRSLQQLSEYRRLPWSFTLPDGQRVTIRDGGSVRIYSSIEYSPIELPSDV